MASVRAHLPKNRTFEWTTYQYRYYNDQAVGEFGAWLATKDWTGVACAVGSNDKANLYQAAVTEAMEKCFPLITVQEKTALGSTPESGGWFLRGKPSTEETEDLPSGEE